MNTLLGHLRPFLYIHDGLLCVQIELHVIESVTDQNVSVFLGCKLVTNRKLIQKLSNV